MSETLTPSAGTTPVTRTPGAFIWHELRTRDVAPAQAFYGALFGWTFEKAQVPDVTYYMIRLNGRDIGGLFDSTGHEMPSHWGGLISVEDVDRAAAIAAANGGEMCGEAQDIPGVGRFAMINDPQGANVGLYCTLHGDPDTSRAEIGEFCWDDLFTTDVAAAIPFYEKVIGWQAEEVGPGMVVFKANGLLEASIGPVPEGVPPHWAVYIAVADLEAATEKAQTLGAKVLMANQDVGGFGRFSVFQDPTGAVVSFFQGNQD